MLCYSVFVQDLGFAAVVTTTVRGNEGLNRRQVQRRLGRLRTLAPSRLQGRQGNERRFQARILDG